MRVHWSTRSRTLLALILAALVAIPTFGTGAAFGAPKRVTQVTIKEFPSKLVIGIVATGPLVWHVTEMSNLVPPRVAIDLMDAVVDPELRTSAELHKGNVLRVRVGQFQESPGIARIVIDFVRLVPLEMQRTAPNILVASIPRLEVSEAGARAVAATPTAAKPNLGTPLQAAAGTGVVQTSQQTEQGPGVLKLLEFRGVALSDVLTALAKLCGFNLVTDDSVKGAITLRLVDVTCEEGFRFILEANNLAFRRLKRNIIVSSAEKLAPPPEVPQTVAYHLDFGNLDQIRAAVGAAVPGVRVAADPRTSSLLVTGTTAQHEEVVKVLASLDVRVAQVMIQVHAVETSMDVLRDLGLFAGLGATGTGASPFGAIGSPQPFPVPPSGSSGSVDSTLNRLLFRIIPTDLLLFKLDALITEGKSRILTAPRVAALDGNKASVNLVDRIPIFTSTPQATGAPIVTVSFVDIGVKLDTTPRVNAGGLLTMNLRSEVSSLLSIDTFSGSQAPRTTNRVAETTLQVKDGETIVLAGLIRREERETTFKVPLLGDIPILGELFRHNETHSVETEVIFLITPTVVKDATP